MLIREEVFCDPNSPHYQGYSRGAIRGKRDRGEWREGREYLKAPDGHLYIILEGFYAWVASARGKHGPKRKRSDGKGQRDQDNLHAQRQDLPPYPEGSPAQSREPEVRAQVAP